MVGANVDRPDVAPVIAARALLRHGLSDDAVTHCLARTWPLDPAECRIALDAAHALARRESSYTT